MITDLRPRDIAHADAIKLQTESGQVIDFKVADSVQFPPGHLREHLVFAQPVTVTYVDGPQGPLATEITD